MKKDADMYNAKMAKHHCDTAYEELFRVRRDFQADKDDIDLDYRLDWAMMRIQAAMTYLNSDIFEVVA